MYTRGGPTQSGARSWRFFFTTNVYAILAKGQQETIIVTVAILTCGLEQKTKTFFACGSVASYIVTFNLVEPISLVPKFRVFQSAVVHGKKYDIK